MATYFSLLKLKQPSPPSPPLTSSLASSQKPSSSARLLLFRSFSSRSVACRRMWFVVLCGGGANEAQVARTNAARSMAAAVLKCHLCSVVGRCFLSLLFVAINAVGRCEMRPQRWLSDRRAPIAKTPPDLLLRPATLPNSVTEGLRARAESSSVQGSERWSPACLLVPYRPLAKLRLPKGSSSPAYHERCLNNIAAYARRITEPLAPSVQLFPCICAVFKRQRQI